MSKLLEEIFRSKKFTNRKGEVLEIYGETSHGQCIFLQEIIRKNDFNRSLEIGLAFGLSALAIVEEVGKNGGRHCAIDKFQQQDWNNNGLDLVQQGGYGDKLDFYEDFSYKVLPVLIERGHKFDFVYIDSTKVFDWLLVDFFLIDKLLDVNGIIVFDDTGYYSVRKLVRFIAGLPHYKIEAPFPFNGKPPLMSLFTGALFSLPLLRHIFKVGLTYADYKKGINSPGCLAIRKTGEDSRDWKWHTDF